MQNQVFLKSNNCCLFEKQGRKIKFVQDLASSFFISVQIFHPIKGNNDLYLNGLIAISAVGFYHWYVLICIFASCAQKRPINSLVHYRRALFFIIFLGHKFFFKVKGPKFLQLVAMYVHVLRLVSDQLSFIFKFLHEKMY